MRVRVPYVPKYLQATPRQKYIQVKFPINCRVTRWPKGSGDVHWPEIFGENGSFWATTLSSVVWAKQPWLAASQGERQLRIEIHDCQVCWIASTCGDNTWVYGHVWASRNRAPAMGQLPPCLRGRFLSQRLGKRHSDRKPTVLWSPS